MLSPVPKFASHVQQRAAIKINQLSNEILQTSSKAQKKFGKPAVYKMIISHSSMFQENKVAGKKADAVLAAHAAAEAALRLVKPTNEVQ